MADATGTTSRKGFAKFWQFLKEVRLEIKKISWPTHKATFKSTLLVIFATVVSAAAIYGFDCLLLLIAGLITRA